MRTAETIRITPRISFRAAVGTSPTNSPPATAPIPIGTSAHALLGGFTHTRIASREIVSGVVEAIQWGSPRYIGGSKDEAHTCGSLCGVGYGNVGDVGGSRCSRVEAYLGGRAFVDRIAAGRCSGPQERLRRLWWLMQPGGEVVAAPSDATPSPPAGGQGFR